MIVRLEVLRRPSPSPQSAVATDPNSNPVDSITPSTSSLCFGGLHGKAIGSLAIELERCVLGLTVFVLVPNPQNAITSLTSKSPWGGGLQQMPEIRTQSKNIEHLGNYDIDTFAGRTVVDSPSLSLIDFISSPHHHPTHISPSQNPSLYKVQSEKENEK